MYVNIHIYLFIYIYIKLFETSGLTQLYRVSTTPPSHRTKLERNSIKSLIVIFHRGALYFSMWNNTKRWSMYTMLSIRATVYVSDSHDKYNSIFKIFENKQNKKSWDYYQYLNIVLSIYRCLEFGTRGFFFFCIFIFSNSIALKCPVPSLTQSAERSMCFPR